MARLFGYIASVPVDCTITFSSQTRAGTHGWGAGWYDVKDKPQVQKGKRTALLNGINASATVTAKTQLLISHMRVASSGLITETNAHPFCYQNWLFAHSGTVHKEKLLTLLKPPYSEKFESEPIDSEVYFRALLQTISLYGVLKGIAAIAALVKDSRGANFLLSDGQSLFAFCYGLPLYWLKWRQQEPLRARSQADTSYHVGLATQPAIIVASERLTNGAWMAFDNGELLIFKKNLQYETVRV